MKNSLCWPNCWLMFPVATWLPPVASAQEGFRNKAKMVVSGSVERPVFGIVQRNGEAVDLSDCPLYPDRFSPVLATLKPFIARAGLTPYNIERQRGELKYLLLTESTQGGMMLRFVLRSHTKLAQPRAALPLASATAAATDGDLRQYPAGSYGHSGRGGGDSVNADPVAGRNVQWGCPCGSALRVFSRPILRSLVRCMPRRATGSVRSR